MSDDWRIKDHGAAGRSWISPRQAKLNVVFVHGFQGEHLATWTHTRRRFRFFGKRHETLLFDLLRSDQTLDCNYFSVGHRAGIVSPVDLVTAGGLITTFLVQQVAATSRNPIVLIGHSFGGLACRVAILSMLKNLKADIPIVGLLMMGTPNSGTEIGRAASALGSSAGADMRPYDEAIEELNREWAAHIVNGGNPDILPSERLPLICWAAVGAEDRVVPRASAAGLASFSDIHYLNKGHIGMVKAENEDDLTYTLISNFLKRAAKQAPLLERERVLQQLTYRLRHASLRVALVREEQEQITLQRDVDSPHQLRCQVRNVRRGGRAQRSLTVAVWLTGHRPSEKIDYDWEVGKGVLTEQEFDAFARDAKKDIEQFFAIEHVRVTCGDKTGPFRLVDRSFGHASMLLRYEAPDWLSDDDPYDKLELELNSFVDRRQGWFIFSVSQTIAERLEVLFQAPFRYSVVSRLGNGAKIQDPTATGGEFTSRATVDGPVALGRTILWVYESSSSSITD